MIERRLQQAPSDPKVFDRNLQRSLAYFQANRYEEAAELSIMLAAHVKHSQQKPSLKAMCLHNLGSALHQLGYHRAAAKYYQESHALFEALPSDCCSCFSKRAQQLSFMRERAIMNAQGIIPEPGGYLNESGVFTQWTESEVKTALSKISEFEAADGKVRRFEAAKNAAGYARGPDYVGGIVDGFAGLVNGTTQVLGTTLKSTAHLGMNAGSKAANATYQGATTAATYTSQAATATYNIVGGAFGLGSSRSQGGNRYYVEK